MYIEVSKLTTIIEAIEKQAIDSQHLRHSEGNHACDENNCSVVIINMAETTSENIDSKINNLLVGGLKINYIKPVNCQWLPSRQRGTPGVVNLRFRNVSDKVAVLKSKHNWKNQRNFRVLIYVQQKPTLKDWGSIQTGCANVKPTALYCLKLWRGAAGVNAQIN